MLARQTRSWGLLGIIHSRCIWKMMLLQKRRTSVPCSHWGWELLWIRCVQGWSSTGPSKPLETKQGVYHLPKHWGIACEGENCGSQSPNLLSGGWENKLKLQVTQKQRGKWTRVSVRSVTKSLALMTAAVTPGEESQWDCCFVSGSFDV